MTTTSKEEEMKSVGELSQVCSQIVQKMVIFVTCWTTRCSSVSEQICTIDHKMDQCLWHTIFSIDFLHSSYMWIQTVLSCEKQCQTMEHGTVSRLRFCRRSWVFENHFWWNIVHFGKSHVRSNQLDVETIFSSTVLVLSYLDVGWRMDGTPGLDLWDLIVTVLHRRTHQKDQERRDPMNSKKIHGKIDLRFFWSNRVFFSWSFVINFWKQRTCHQDDCQRKKSSPTMSVSRTSRVACLMESISTPRSKSNTNAQWHREPIRRHIDKGKFTRDEWWNHLGCLVNFGSINVLKRCRKEWKKMQVKKVLLFNGVDSFWLVNAQASDHIRRTRSPCGWFCSTKTWRTSASLVARTIHHFMRGRSRFANASRHSHTRVTSESTQIDDEVLVAIFAATVSSAATYAATLASCLVIEHVVPALLATHVAPTLVFACVAPAFEVENVAQAPAVIFDASSQQLFPSYTSAIVATDVNFDIIGFWSRNFSVLLWRLLRHRSLFIFFLVKCARVQPSPSGTDRCRGDNPEHMWNPSCARTVIV